MFISKNNKKSPSETVLTPAFDFVIIKLQLFNVFLCATGCHAWNTCQNCKILRKTSRLFLSLLPFSSTGSAGGGNPLVSWMGRRSCAGWGKDSAQLFPDAGRQSAADLGKGKAEFKSSLLYWPWMPTFWVETDLGDYKWLSIAYPVVPKDVDPPEFSSHNRGETRPSE